MMDRYEHWHAELTDRYYRQGNPDGYTPAEFRILHDAIWIEKDLAEGRIAQDRADELMDTVRSQADGEK